MNAKWWTLVAVCTATFMLLLDITVPLVGGVLTEGIGWVAIFFVNVPIGIGAVALTIARVEESRARDDHGARPVQTPRVRVAGMVNPALRRGGEVADFIAFGGARRTGSPQLARLGEQAFVAGLNHLLLLAGLLAFLGAPACALLVRAADFRAAVQGG
jgi:hypothetical protein